MKWLTSIRWNSPYGPLWFARLFVVAALLSIVSTSVAITFVIMSIGIAPVFAYKNRKAEEARMHGLSADAQSVLRRLEGHDIDSRSIAVLEMRAEGPQFVDKLHDALDAQLKAAGSRVPDHRLRLTLAFVLCTGSTAMVRCAVAPVSFWTFASIFLFCGVAAEVATLILMPPGQRALISALAKIGDVRSVRYFVEAVASGDTKTRSLALEMLIRVLPAMSEEDAAIVPKAQRTTLFRRLLSDEAGLVRAILIALPAFDDADALPMVEKLAAGRGLAKTDPEIRAIAAGLLPTLTARRALEHCDKTLLRASSKDTGNSSTALRATGFASTDPKSEQLLRAGSPNNSDTNQ